MSVPSDMKLDIPEKAKTELRHLLLTMRRSLEPEKRMQWDRQISQHIERYLKEHVMATLGIYFSIRNEPELTHLYETLSRKGFSLSLPMIVKKEAPLQFVRWKPGDALINGNFGIPVPQVQHAVPLPDAILVPCLGFTSDRFRLGYGGGYFDRTLEQKPRPHTIGVAYSCLKTQFEIQKYDIPMDCIITEEGVI